jgi:hypothetical protein
LDHIQLQAADYAEVTVIRLVNDTFSFCCAIISSAALDNTFIMLKQPAFGYNSIVFADFSGNRQLLVDPFDSVCKNYNYNMNSKILAHLAQTL